MESTDFFRAFSLGAFVVFVLSGASFGVTVFSDNMESGVNGWNSTGFWHRQTSPQNICIISAINPALVSLPDNGCLPLAYSGSAVWWYGETSTGTFIGADYVNYTQSAKNGGHSMTYNEGSLVSPVIDLSGASSATLSFRSWYEIEGVDVDRYDMMSVYVSTDNGYYYTLLDSINPLNDVDGEYFRPYSSGGLGQVGVWTTQQFDLSNYAGTNQVRLKFEFSTEDSLYNGFRGWLIDDVAVTTGGAVSPTITNITPSTGPMDTIIYISGTNFMSGATVYIGSTSCSSVSVFSSTSIHAMIPSALTTGTYNVTVTNPTGYGATLPNGFTFTTTQPPSITSISPVFGLNNKTTSVVISGSNFQSGATAYIASTPLTSVVVVNSSKITAIVPTGLSSGYQNVKVTNPDSQYDLLVGGFYVNGTTSATTTTSSTTTTHTSTTTTHTSTTTTASTTTTHASTTTTHTTTTMTSTTSTTTTTMSGKISVARDLPSSASAGSDVTVTLAMDVNEANPPVSVGLTEYYPSGWTVSGIGSGGIDKGDRVEWVCSSITYCNIEDQSITYTVTVPDDLEGAYGFSGNFYYDGAYHDTTGDTALTVIVGCELTGDYAPCGEVTLSEVIDIINLWSQGQMSLSNVINLINVWADV